MSSSEFAGPEFVVGSAKGIRVWRADSLGRLTGWTHRQVWLPGENIAHCRKDKDERAHLNRLTYGLEDAEQQQIEPCEQVNPDCSCGFWAYHSGIPDFGSDEGIVGIIEGYGKTTIGTKGFRCEKGRILALAFPKTLCGCEHDQPFAQDEAVEALVRRNYPDVKVFDSVADMVAEFPPDQPEQPTPDSPDFWTMEDPASPRRDSWAQMLFAPAMVNPFALNPFALNSANPAYPRLGAGLTFSLPDETNDNATDDGAAGGETASTPGRWWTRWFR